MFYETEMSVITLRIDVITLRIDVITLTFYTYILHLHQFYETEIGDDNADCITFTFYIYILH
jgi:hypothetical protein